MSSLTDIHIQRISITEDLQYKTSLITFIGSSPRFANVQFRMICDEPTNEPYLNIPLYDP